MAIIMTALRDGCADDNEDAMLLLPADADDDASMKVVVRSNA